MSFAHIDMTQRLSAYWADFEINFTFKFGADGLCPESFIIFFSCSQCELEN